MRILVVQESDWLARGPHQQHHLMEKLALRGHETRVIDFEIAWKAKRSLRLFSRRQVFEGVSKIHKNAAVTVVRPAILRIPHLDYTTILLSHTREIVRQIKEFKPDVIVGFGILNSYVAMRLARRHKIPFVYYLIDSLHTLVPFKAYQPIAKAIESRTLQAADRILAINGELRNYAIWMGGQPHKTAVIRAGIDIERFQPKIDGQKIRKLYGINRDDVVLFFMGWLYSFSGLREVTLELAKARERFQNLRLLVVGEGDLLSELRKAKDTHNLSQLILVGRQPYDKIPAFVSASDICLLPARENAVMSNIVPIKMYEYMACAKPVIATKLQGIMKEFGFSNGVIYVDRAEDVLEKAVDIREDIQELGEKARHFVEKLDWDVITDEFEDVLMSSSIKNISTIRS